MVRVVGSLQIAIRARVGACRNPQSACLYHRRRGLHSANWELCLPPIEDASLRHTTSVSEARARSGPEIHIAQSTIPASFRDAPVDPPLPRFVGVSGRVPKKPGPHNGKPCPQEFLHRNPTSAARFWGDNQDDMAAPA